MPANTTTEYKYASAHEWLREYLVRENDIHRLRELAYQFAQKRMDGDDIQEMFEKEMDADGYFTPEPRHAPDCSRDCDVMPDGRLACATPINEI